jgi:hypothetical protein
VWISQIEIARLFVIITANLYILQAKYDAQMERINIWISPTQTHSRRQSSVAAMAQPTVGCRLPAFADKWPVV